MAVKQIPRDRFPRIILARIFADGPDLLYIQVASIIVTSYILARMLREKLLSWNLSFSVSNLQIVITRSGFITQNVLEKRCVTRLCQDQQRELTV